MVIAYDIGEIAKAGSLISQERFEHKPLPGLKSLPSVRGVGNIIVDFFCEYETLQCHFPTRNQFIIEAGIDQVAGSVWCLTCIIDNVIAGLRELKPPPVNMTTSNVDA